MSTDSQNGEFASRADYDALVEALLTGGAIPDTGMVYFDVRPSQRYETLEVRVADVCLTVDDAVLLGGLVRALVRTAAEAAQQERPFPRWRSELVRGAHWRAARWGLSAELVSPLTGRLAPAGEVIDGLLDHVRSALEAAGDLDEVTALVDQVRRAGTGAERQRAAFARRWSFDDVVAMAVEATTP